MSSSQLPHETFSDFADALEKLKTLALDRQLDLDSLPTIADPCPLTSSAKILPRDVPDKGWGLSKSLEFLLQDVAPLLNPGHAGPRYFGFITGGTLPSALLSDWFTSLYDQNVQVHLPKETSSTVIEAYTIDMIIKLLNMESDLFAGTLTTGATSSNLLALICARETTMKRCMSKGRGIADWSAAEHGLTGFDLPLKVFVSQAHASIKKAAALAGIGRANVIDLGRKRNDLSLLDIKDEQLAARFKMECLDFDLDRLEMELRQCHENHQPAIVVVGMGEVVTGALSDQTLLIRKLCDKYDAWQHMDAGKSLQRIAAHRS
jgi:glutamate/tyrosine decarboxylase-like PLP-dependent enzyme